MKIVVCGGRRYNERFVVFDYLDMCHRAWPGGITHVVTGGATGADTFGAEWATTRGVPQTVLRPDWGKYGRTAGLVRNVAMADTNPDLVIVFPGGRGTEHMVRVALKRGICVDFACDSSEYLFDIDSLF